MHRSPTFFKNTTFLVDTFHSRGHVCSPCLKLSKVKYTNSKFHTVRDSMAEARNSQLRKLAGPLRNMGTAHAVLGIKLFLEIEMRLLIQDRQHFL
jgi:hypothetical protein